MFRIEDSAFGRRLNIANNRIRVTLKCDFIIDCRGNPVDGNHLHGARPTGNGTPPVDERLLMNGEPLK